MLQTFSYCQSSWTVLVEGSHGAAVTSHEMSSSYQRQSHVYNSKRQEGSHDHRIKTSVFASRFSSHKLTLCATLRKLSPPCGSIK